MLPLSTSPTFIDRKELLFSIPKIVLRSLGFVCSGAIAAAEVEWLLISRDRDKLADETAGLVEEDVGCRVDDTRWDSRDSWSIRHDDVWW